MKQQANGLHLQGKQIRQLSGPATLYYLKPSDMTVWNTFHAQGIDLPLLLFMGDVHRSELGRCHPCDKNSPYTTCYSVEDKEFLRLFDKLAEQTPIDFFTESSEEKMTPERFQRMGVLHRLEEVSHKAHRVSERSRPPRPNNKNDPLLPIMRWHHADARFMSRWVESSLLRAWSQYLKDAVKARSEPSVKARTRRTPPPPPLPPLPPLSEEVRQVQRRILSWILEPRADTPEETAHGIVNEIITALSGPLADQSIIMKQYRQSALSHYFPLEMLIPILGEDLAKDKTFLQLILFFKGFHTSPTPAFQHLKQLFEQALASPENLPLFPPHEEDTTLNQYMNLFSVLLTTIGTSLLDLYFLFRMLKEPKGSTTATLCIAYMGQKHIESLIRLFTHPVFGYTVSFQMRGSMIWDNVPTHAVLRCLQINTNVPLESDVMEHHQRRFAERPDLLARWHRILHQEKQSREQANNLPRPSPLPLPSPSPLPPASPNNSPSHARRVIPRRSARQRQIQTRSRTKIQTRSTRKTHSTRRNKRHQSPATDES